MEQEKQLIFIIPKLNIALSGTSYQAIHMTHFIYIPCKKSADDLLKLSRYLMRVLVPFLMVHAPVKKHVNFMGLFNGSLILQD